MWQVEATDRHGLGERRLFGPVHMDDIHDLCRRSAIDAVTTVSSTLKTLENDITAAYNMLSKLDPGSELQQAFKSAPDCASFRSSQ